jgi:hypothetical protein
MPEQPDDIIIDKTKFDALLRKIAHHPALKPEERQVGPRPGYLYRPKRKAKPKKSE